VAMTRPGIERLSHVVSGRQFDREMLESIFARASALETVRDHRLDGRIMAALFYEPSTRTRLSFESAMLRLGGSVIGTEAARQFSSAVKGETLEDTVRVIDGYADVIVLRHDEAGAAERAAAVSRVPVINAGDGPGEHPTQALLDVYTIHMELGRIDGLRVALCGDMGQARTTRSLALMLSLYDNLHITFVMPETCEPSADVIDRLRERGVSFDIRHALDQAIEDIDVVYLPRVQVERYADPAERNRLEGRFRLTPELMTRVPSEAIIMTPLPRRDEIDVAVDADPRAAYFRQARNGVAIRMALLDMLLL